ncbi:MAG: hypothetical protein QOI50_6892, partial [Pseudonocardiales bacterium]|nr:hypothetical protein [Pseudonocardiales bacterium]
MTNDGRVPSVVSDQYPEPADLPAQPSHLHRGKQSADPDVDTLPDDSPMLLRRELRRQAANGSVPAVDTNTDTAGPDTAPGARVGGGG